MTDRADKMLQFGQKTTGLELREITADTVVADMKTCGAALVDGADPTELAIELTMAGGLALDGDRNWSRELLATTSAQKAFLRKVRSQAEKLRDTLSIPHTDRERGHVTPQGVATVKLEGLLKLAGVKTHDLSDILNAIGFLAEAASAVLDDKHNTGYILALNPSLVQILSNENGEITQEAIDKFRSDMDAEAARSRAGPLAGLCELLVPVVNAYIAESATGSRHPDTQKPSGPGLLFLAAQIERLGFRNEPLKTIQEAALNAARKLKKHNSGKI